MGLLIDDYCWEEKFLECIVKFVLERKLCYWYWFENNNSLLDGLIFYESLFGNVKNCVFGFCI